jgi:hypothetical protein
MADALHKDTDDLAYLTAFTAWMSSWVLFHPVRAIKRYSDSRIYFQRRGISEFEFLSGKRVRKRGN